MLYPNKQQNLEKVVSESIKISGSRNFIVALSGGADSVALLTALVSLRQTRYKSDSSLSITAAHCNFHLRGEESMRDQHFVESLCRRLDVPLLIKDFDVQEYQLSHPGTSTEMACRELRYDWFRSLLDSKKSARLVTGHNADDNIETLFLNLLRGSGTTGLRGMLTDTGTILRPLLTIHRKEIESYLNYKGETFITDSTNLESDYRRNFLRNEILPQLRTRWPGLDKALDRSLRLLKAENDVVEQAVADALPAPGKPLLRKDTLLFPAPELLVRRYILPLSPLTTTPSEIVAAMRADKPDIRRWQLPGGTVTLRGGKLWLTPNPTDSQHNATKP